MHSHILVCCLLVPSRKPLPVKERLVVKFMNELSTGYTHKQGKVERGDIMLKPSLRTARQYSGYCFSVSLCKGDWIIKNYCLRGLRSKCTHSTHVKETGLRHNVLLHTFSFDLQMNWPSRKVSAGFEKEKIDMKKNIHLDSKYALHSHNLSKDIDLHSLKECSG